MFWALIMEPKRKYRQVVKKSFHITMAAIDCSSASDKIPNQIMLIYKGKKYLICTLENPTSLSVPLDLKFSRGSDVSFASNGNYRVTLSGYKIDDKSKDDTMKNDESSEQEISVQSNLKRKRNIKKTVAKKHSH